MNKEKKPGLLETEAKIETKEPPSLYPETENDHKEHAETPQKDHAKHGKTRLSSINDKGI